MAFLTQNTLRSTIDLPIALPATTLRQSDWVVAATVLLNAGQQLSLRSLAIHFISAAVDVSTIAPSNLIVPALGTAYTALCVNYVSGVPGQNAPIDTLTVNSLGVVTRSVVPLLITTPGYYSLLVANNTQSSLTSTIPTGTSIDLQVAVTGMLRLQLFGA